MTSVLIFFIIGCSEDATTPIKAFQADAVATVLGALESMEKQDKMARKVTVDCLGDASVKLMFVAMM